jgi:rhamnulokinase
MDKEKLMSEKKCYLAIDLGASSGRAVVGYLDQGHLKYEEIHRFPNYGVELGGTLYWDILRIYHEIETILLKAKAYPIKSLSIDSWGVDFALVDKAGRLLENPVHYRDDRTIGQMEKVFSKIPSAELYQRTGVERIAFNSIYQLNAFLENRPDLVPLVDRVLFIPDYLNFLLTGQMRAEETIAGTSQLLDIRKRDWDDSIFDKLGLPRHWFSPLIKPGEVLGTLRPDLAKRLGIPEWDVVAGASHDTQSALAAVPAREENFLYLSSGTWSLLGTELDSPMVNAASEADNFTNELAYGDKVSFHKNIMGLWLIQQSKAQWAAEGQDLSYDRMVDLASVEEAGRFIFNPDHPSLNNTDNMPQAIQALCLETLGRAPQSKGQILRAIYDSLAEKYKEVAGQIESLTKKTYNSIYIIGGGSQNALLNRLTAEALGMTVYAGPVEATAIGNIMVQAIAGKEVASLEEARRIVAKTED